MKREPSKTRGRIILTLIIFCWFIVTILFGFIFDKPTSPAGLVMIITFLVFIICIFILFLYKKRRLF